MKKEHHYTTTIQWTGNRGKGTFGYRSFKRNYTISIANKPDILGSSDPAYRGDKTKHNPEELLVASLSSCHMLWYLHLCSESKIVVTQYQDSATGTMIENNNGSGCFSTIYLNPIVVVANTAMIEKAIELHNKANDLCFIANSVNFKILHNPKCLVEEDSKL
ncbi:OsmC family protein [Aquimarina algicola]|uniref:OsmC family peroxiredoxin n=1 Tax=Aquimarina algicola TaxID=2589995 RepID=A0A504JKD9_9FLAO|nr:OsmC family protein [Aquimarina algicola]TPN87219.1 OsmC family peroxiredoxin [Aquimarina algicola]